MNSILIQIRQILKIPSFLLLFLAAQAWTARSQTTKFSVQGRLTDSGLSANGNYEMRFSTYAASSGGSAISTFIPPSPISVADGVFTSTVDFGGGVFTGPDRWLQIEVRPLGTNVYTVLSNRVLLTSSPYTIRSLEAASLSAGSLTASQIQVAGGPPSAGKVLGFDGTSLIWTTASGGSGYWSQIGSNVYYNGGNVGIGTNGPIANLHMYDPANSVTDLIETGGGINAWAKVQFKNLNGQWDIGTSRGFVGDVFYIDRIGTPELEFTLAPSGNLGLGTAPLTDTRMTVHTSPNTGFSAHYGIEHSDGTHRLSTILDSYGAWLGTRTGDPLNFFVNDNYAASETASMTIDASGRVGIGTPSPVVNLDVRGSGITETTIWSTSERAILSLHSTLPGSQRVWTLESGVAGLPGVFGIFDRTAGQARMTIDPSGNTVFGGGNVSVCSLTIRGGCDVAEPFDLAGQEIPKGAVVIIDDEHPGKLKLSQEAYDTRVAGIVSGANGINPGISLHQEGAIEGGNNVALSGRVYVQADASFGAIKPGDLLTTSDTPGHAMKVKYPERAQGAILGKAMSELRSGRGMVLVLVTLE